MNHTLSLVRSVRITRDTYRQTVFCPNEESARLFEKQNPNYYKCFSIPVGPKTRPKIARLGRHDWVVEVDGQEIGYFSTRSRARACAAEARFYLWISEVSR